MSDLYQALSVDEILGLMLRALNATRPTIATQPGAPVRLDYAAIAQAIADNHHHLEALARNVTPLDADEIGLSMWAIVTEVPRKPGTPARKAQSARARGVATTLIPSGSVLNADNLIQYQTTAAANIGAGGDVLLDIEALTPGTVTRLAAGDQLVFDVSITDVEDAVTLVEDLDEGGTDEQSLGAWRDDIMRVFREGRQGGARSDYEIWAHEVTWVDRAYVYPNKPSIASVGIAALKSGTGTAQIATTVQRDELLAHLETKRPVTDTVVWIITSLTALQAEVTITLDPNVVPDWSAPGAPGITLASYDAGTQTVTINESLPADFEAGDLFTLVNPTPVAGADGRPTRVAAVTAATTFVVAPAPGFSQPFGYTPVAGDEIWPSSQLMADVRTDVLEGFTLCVVVNGQQVEVQLPGLLELGPANPNRKYGRWNADARASAVIAIASSRPEVISALALIAPTDPISEAQEFPYPNNTTVELFDPQQVWVHA